MGKALYNNMTTQHCVAIILLIFMPLQIFLSLKKSKLLGIYIPIISFLYAIFETYIYYRYYDYFNYYDSLGADGTYAQWQMGRIIEFLLSLFFLPILYLSIYFLCKLAKHIKTKLAIRNTEKSQ